jgi:hypothetical protein
VLGYIESAREQGAQVLAGGGRPPSLPRGNFLEATVIGDVGEGMRVFQEEREIMIQAMPYCGIPAALDGIRNAAAVLDELGVA